MQQTVIEFLELLRKRHISYLNYTHEELEEEFATLQKFKPPNQKGFILSHFLIDTALKQVGEI